MLTDNDIKKIGAVVDEKIDKSLAKFGVEMDRKMDKRFVEFGVEMDRKMDKRFVEFGVEMDRKMDKRFVEFGAVVDEKIGNQLKPIKKDISQIRKDMKEIVNFFDKEYLDLRNRVERIEQFLKISIS